MFSLLRRLLHQPPPQLACRLTRKVWGCETVPLHQALCVCESARKSLFSCFARPIASWPCMVRHRKQESKADGNTGGALPRGCPEGRWVPGGCGFGRWDTTALPGREALLLPSGPRDAGSRTCQSQVETTHLVVLDTSQSPVPVVSGRC